MFLNYDVSNSTNRGSVMCISFERWATEYPWIAASTFCASSGFGIHYNLLMLCECEVQKVFFTDNDVYVSSVLKIMTPPQK